MLTPKQRIFIEQYLVDSNATRAYVAAGYSPKLAHTNANKLLLNTTIKTEIERIRAAQSKKLEITREGLLQDLMDIKDDQKKGFPPAALKAIEMLLKAQGWDKPKEEQTSTNDDAEIKITIVRKDGNTGNQNI